METFITMLSIFGILAVGYGALVNARYKQFRRYLRPGHPVAFYIGEERHYGTVTEITAGTITITHHKQDYYRSPEDTYPILGVDYAGSVIQENLTT